MFGTRLTTTTTTGARATVRANRRVECLRGVRALSAARRDADSVHDVVATDDVVDKDDAGREAQRMGLLALGATTLSVVSTDDAAYASQALIDPFYAFSPVCPASDGVFRVGQRAAIGLAGDENIENYRPLINDVLIRVRTELCVLESFVRETAIPFVREKGVGWVLPAHETSETYLAGVVFMLGANFILLGSTKVVAIIAIYHDITLGLATRLAGKALGVIGPGNQREKREQELNKVMDEQMVELKKVMSNWTLGKGKREEKTQQINDKYAAKLEAIREAQDERADRDAESGLSNFRKIAGGIAVPLNVYGTVSSQTRKVLEIFDTFCSRYFVAFTVSYIIVKTLHYTVLSDFP